MSNEKQDIIAEDTKKKRYICIICENENQNIGLPGYWSRAWAKSELDFVPNICEHCAIAIGIAALGWRLMGGPLKEDKHVGKYLHSAGMAMYTKRTFATKWGEDYRGEIYPDMTESQMAEMKRQMPALLTWLKDLRLFTGPGLFTGTELDS